MKYFSRDDLLKSLKRIHKELDKINENESFLKMLEFLDLDIKDIEKTEYFYTNNIIEDIFVLWYESGICVDFSTEVDFLILVDKTIDLLDISRIEFYAYITKQEKLIPVKYQAS